jgi:hypothetical protein
MREAGAGTAAARITSSSTVLVLLQDMAWVAVGAGATLSTGRATSPTRLAVLLLLQVLVVCTVGHANSSSSASH